jgi:hypothetical protein
MKAQADRYRFIVVTATAHLIMCITVGIEAGDPIDLGSCCRRVDRKTRNEPRQAQLRAPANSFCASAVSA